MIFSPLPHIRKYLRNRLQDTVSDGPYRGLVLCERPSVDCYEAKLMGTYEKELHPIMELLLQKQLQSLTVIGAAEGYHAIGMGRRTSLAPVCFEQDEKARQNLKEIAEINQVPVEIHDRFTSQTDYQPSPGLIIIDIEGQEQELLHENQFAAWRQHHFIIEIHGDEIKTTIEQASASLFKTRWVPTKKRTIRDYPFDIPLKYLLRRWWNVPVQEWRSDSIGWLLLTPKA